MPKLGKRFVEINRGYEQISVTYQRPYITGIDINSKEKPIVVASGAMHADTGACVISLEEFISGKWDEHIRLSNCYDFVEKLKSAIDKGEDFPQNCIISLVIEREMEKKI